MGESGEAKEQVFSYGFGKDAQSICETITVVDALSLLVDDHEDPMVCLFESL